MRLDINLATRPYEDSREFWTLWGLGVGALGLLTLVLLGWAISGWVSAGRDRRNIAQLQQQIAERDRERAGDQAILDLTANRSTRDQSQFLNGLIQRKAFSWTRVFEDLERVMPPNLHAVSLRPELNEQGQMLLEMKVAGETRSAAVELVHRMEGSKHFQSAQLVQSQGAGAESGAAVSAVVIAVYIPDSTVSDALSNSKSDTKDRSGK
jgi:type IV pilus assembly protein PilN